MHELIIKPLFYIKWFVLYDHKGAFMYVYFIFVNVCVFKI